MKLIVRFAGLVLLASAAVAHPHTDEGCETYTWSLSREFAALDAPGKSIVASDDEGRKRWIATGRHYAASLRPQPEVKFATKPGRARNPENAAAGLLHFRSGKAGRYRISLSSHHWIDVVHHGKPVDSIAHEGRSGCARLHKVVEFDLPARRAITIQLSGGDRKNVSVVVTGPA
jgi:hypothetical protein